MARHFGSHAAVLLERVLPGMTLSNDAADMAEAFARDLFERICEEARFLAEVSERTVISSREVQTALRLVVPFQLALLGVSEGVRAVTRYTAGARPGVAASPSVKKTEKQKVRVLLTVTSAAAMQQVLRLSYLRLSAAGRVQAGLEIDPNMIRRMMRDRVFPEYKIGGGAPLYCAAVLESQLTAVLKPAGKLAQLDSRTEVRAGDMARAIQNSRDLTVLASAATIVEGADGVWSYSAPFPRRRDAAEEAAEFESAAPREESAFGAKRFALLVREVAQAYKSDLRFEKRALAELQDAAEGFLEGLFAKMQRNAEASGRDTVLGADMLASFVAESCSFGTSGVALCDRLRAAYGPEAPPVEALAAVTLRDERPRAKRKARVAKGRKGESGPTAVLSGFGGFSVPPAAPPVGAAGMPAAFVPPVFEENGVKLQLMSVSFLPDFADVSVEELRAREYALAPARPDANEEEEYRRLDAAFSKLDGFHRYIQLRARYGQI